MKQFVCMNKNSGNIGLCARVVLFDNNEFEEPLANLEGYSVTLRSSDFDGYLVESTFTTNGNMWLWCPKEHFENICEIIGEL